MFVCLCVPACLSVFFFFTVIVDSIFISIFGTDSACVRMSIFFFLNNFIVVSSTNILLTCMFYVRTCDTRSSHFA